MKKDIILFNNILLFRCFRKIQQKGQERLRDISWFTVSPREELGRESRTVLNQLKMLETTFSNIFKAKENII